MNKKRLLITISSIIIFALLIFFAIVGQDFIPGEISSLPIAEDAEKSCSEQNGMICSSSQSCSGSWLDASDSGMCCCGECQVAKEFSINFLRKTEIQDGDFTEIVASNNRVFVVYLVPETTRPGGKEHRVMIFDKELNEITSKTLTSFSTEYGYPMDIRIATDGNYAYIFYMMVTGYKGSYLFGKKYILDDNFEEVAKTGVITQAKRQNIYGGCLESEECAEEGDERIDDPAPMIAGDYVYVMTGIISDVSKDGDTIYKIRKFDNNLNKLDEFDLDLSSVTDGETGQSSILYKNGHYYILRATITKVCEGEMWACPADIDMIELDNNWNILDSKTIANDKKNGQECNEQYVSGFQSDEENYYVAYNRACDGMSSILKIYDNNWNEILEEELRVATGGGVRPSIFVNGNDLYSGNIFQQNEIAEVSVYEIVR